MYNTPAGNPINNYTYKDLEALYPIYIGYQEQYYNTYQPTSLSQRINDPSNKGPSKQPLYAMGQMENYDHLSNPVTQFNPNNMVKYCKPYYSMTEPNDEIRQTSNIIQGHKTSNVSVHGYNIY
jgi:hypothetical protein